MADLKISQLTSATLPLAGTEVLPIVQSSSTKKVATNDLTVKNVRSNATTGILQVAGPGVGATRTMTTPDANFTVARTDAAQTFTGDQKIAGVLVVNAQPATAGVGYCTTMASFGSLANGKSIRIDLDFNIADGTFIVEVFAKALNSSNGQNAEIQAIVKGSKIGGTFYDSAVSVLYAARFSTPTITNVASTQRIYIDILNNDGQTFNSHQGVMLRIFGSDAAFINSVTVI